MKEIVIALIASGFFTTIATIINGLFQNRKKDKDGIKSGVQIILYKQIKDACKEFITQGFIYYEDLEDTERAWKIYHNQLGGNGYLDELMSTIRELPKRE